ncbi:MAG: Uma2 family endonuclease [Clostridia bacterium]|nr:MAG: Uma2 family endonuclease [Clostridia bacterium]
MVVEIFSPSTSQTDRLVKAQIYARHGVSYYWLLDPDKEELEDYVSQNGTLLSACQRQHRGALPRARTGLDCSSSQRLQAEVRFCFS